MTSSKGLERRVAELSYDIGEFMVKMNPLLVPLAGLKFLGGLGYDVVSFGFRKTKRAGGKIIENYQSGLGWGSARTLGDIVKYTLTGGLKLGKRVVEEACSLRGQAVFLGLVTAFYIYLDNAGEYFPLDMGLESVWDYFTFLPSVAGNVVHAGVKGVWDGVTGLGEGIWHLSFGEIKEAVDVGGDVLNLPGRTLSQASFANFHRSIKSVVDNWMFILGGMEIGKRMIRSYNWLVGERRSKDGIYNKGFLSRISGKFSTTMAAYGLTLFGIGKSAEYYAHYTGLLSTGNSILGTLLSVSDYFLGYVNLAFTSGKYVVSHFLTEGLPDTVSFFAGRWAGEICDFYKHIQDDAEMMIKGGIAALAISLISGLYSSYTHYKHHNPY